MTCKWQILTVAFVSVFFFILQNAMATEEDKAKAKEYMQAAMYPQAATLLEKRIYDTPTDADAHFHLGICYLHLGEEKAAQKRFESAVKLDPTYEPQVERELNRSGVKAQKQKARDDQLKRSVYDVKKMLNLE